MVYFTDEPSAIVEKKDCFLCFVDTFALAHFLDPRFHRAVYSNAGTFEDIKEWIIKVYDVVMGEASEKLSMESETDLCHREINAYLSTIKMPHTSTGTKMMEWWKSRSGNFPVLAKLEGKYLMVPASSATSE